MATTTMNYQPMNKPATSLTVLNLPVTADEEELHELFPAARGVRLFRSQANPPNSQNACVLQFNTPDDCFKAFSEFQRGKELGGRMLRAELGEAAAARERFQPQPTTQQQDDTSHAYPQERSEMYSSNKSYNSRPQYASDDNNQNRIQEREKRNTDSVLIVSNLPYSTTQQDLEREFQTACNITLNRDDRGRPSGVAQVSFRTREECDVALLACNNMTLNGRNLRGRIGTNQGSSNSDMRRSFENRPSRGRGDSGNSQRNYDNRSDYGRMDPGNAHRNYDSRPGQNRNEYGGMQQREYGNRQGNQNYNANRRDFDDGRRSNNTWRGGRGRGDSGDFGRGRQDRFAPRRERSPGQGEPVRGYAGSKGFRITSAVISGSGSPSSHSSSGSD